MAGGVEWLPPVSSAAKQSGRNRAGLLRRRNFAAPIKIIDILAISRELNSGGFTDRPLGRKLVPLYVMSYRANGLGAVRRIVETENGILGKRNPAFH